MPLSQHNLLRLHRLEVMERRNRNFGPRLVLLLTWPCHSPRRPAPATIRRAAAFRRSAPPSSTTASRASFCSPVICRRRRRRGRGKLDPRHRPIAFHKRLDRHPAHICLGHGIHLCQLPEQLAPVPKQCLVLRQLMRQALVIGQPSQQVSLGPRLVSLELRIRECLRSSIAQAPCESPRPSHRSSAPAAEPPQRQTAPDTSPPG